MSISLPNVSEQYRARINAALSLVDDDVTEAEGIALLHEIAQEPFLPIWHVLAVNLALCWNTTAEVSQPYFVVARQAYDEILDRWPNISELSDSYRESWAKYTKLISYLEDAIPRGIERDRLLLLSESADQNADEDAGEPDEVSEEDMPEDSSDAMILDPQVGVLEPQTSEVSNADPFAERATTSQQSVLPLDLDRQMSEIMIADPFIDREPTTRPSIMSQNLRRRISRTSLQNAVRTFSSLRNEIVHAPTLPEDDHSPTTVENDNEGNSDKKNTVAKSSGKGSGSTAQRTSSISRHFPTTKSSSSGRRRPADDDHYISGSPAQKERHE